MKTIEQLTGFLNRAGIDPNGYGNERLPVNATPVGFAEIETLPGDSPFMRWNYVVRIYNAQGELFTQAFMNDILSATAYAAAFNVKLRVAA